MIERVDCNQNIGGGGGGGRGGGDDSGTIGKKNGRFVLVMFLVVAMKLLLKIL